jgi:hypothetical protein
MAVDIVVPTATCQSDPVGLVHRAIVARFRYAQNARRRREPAILNDGGKELEIVQVAHHRLVSYMDPGRRSPVPE